MLLCFSFFTASAQTDATHPIIGYQKKIFPSISEASLLLLVISYSHLLTCCYYFNIFFVESYHFDQMIIYFPIENHCYLSTLFAAFVFWLLSLESSKKKSLRSPAYSVQTWMQSQVSPLLSCFPANIFRSLLSEVQEHDLQCSSRETCILLLTFNAGI